MSKIEVNEIDKTTGSTLTLGGSGTAVTLACGATQTGFGRTGTVDWQTGSIKTATFTAVNGQGFFADTSSGAFVMNLPAGTAGNIVSVVDYTNTFQTNNLTITPNGSQKIGGVNDSTALSTEGQSVTFVYVDDTEGWKNVQDSTSNVSGRTFIAATGGTVTTVNCGQCKVHTFTGPGTFCVSAIATTAEENVVSYMVIAGGGGGGYCMGGGGGAGGYREVKSPTTPYTASPLDGYSTPANRLTVTVAGIPVTVGGGGAGSTGPDSPPAPRGTSGANSTFSTITSAGGGGGGSRNGGGSPPHYLGIAGGSGGGNSNDSPTSNVNPAGNTPPVSPPQGQPGGFGRGNTGVNTSGGGGGATAAGGNGSGPGPAPTMGPGGAGATSSINGTPTGRAGGGAGGKYSAPGGQTAGTVSDGGGLGGPGAANGTANTGGGGGGAGHTADGTPNNGGTGGSGIVIIRYKIA